MVEWIGTQKKHLGKRKNEIWVETRWNCVWRLKSDYVQYHMYHSVWCGTATCRQVPFLVRKLFFGRKWLSRVLIPASAISASPLQLESSCVICIKKKVDPWHSRSPCDLRHHITEVIKPGRRIVQDDFESRRPPDTSIRLTKEGPRATQALPILSVRPLCRWGWLALGRQSFLLPQLFSEREGHLIEVSLQNIWPEGTQRTSSHIPDSKVFFFFKLFRRRCCEAAAACAIAHGHGKLLSALERLRKKRRAPKMLFFYPKIYTSAFRLFCSP